MGYSPAHSTLDSSDTSRLLLLHALPLGVSGEASSEPSSEGSNNVLSRMLNEVSDEVLDEVLG